MREKQFKSLLKLDIQTFAGDNNPEPNPEPTPPNDPLNPDGGNDPTPETFTAEQVEAFKKEASQQAKMKLYEELGVKTMKELQEKITASATKDEADAVLKTTNQQLQSEIEQLKTERAFMQEAFKHTPHDIGLLFAAVAPLLQRDPDTSEITNMSAAIEKVKKEKPFLFVTTSPEGGGQPNEPITHPQPGGGNPPTQKKGLELGKDLAARFNSKIKGGSK